MHMVLVYDLVYKLDLSIAMETETIFKLLPLEKIFSFFSIYKLYKRTKTSQIYSKQQHVLVA